MSVPQELLCASEDESTRNVFRTHGTKTVFAQNVQNERVGVRESDRASQMTAISLTKNHFGFVNGMSQCHEPKSHWLMA